MDNPTDKNVLQRAVLRLDFRVLGITLGLLFGLVMFIATNWLVLRGGQVDASGETRPIGVHLGLLRHYFLGYSVSFWGSIVGFLYGFALGTITGAALGWLYNALMDIRRKLGGGAR